MAYSNVTKLSDRDPGPINFDAEKALLGAVLANNGVFDRCDPLGLKAEHFADPLHGRIWHAVGRLREVGRIANVPTLKAYFDQDGALKEIGGAQYLVELSLSVVTVINADDYARVLIDLYQRREMIGLAREMEARARIHDIVDGAGQIGAEFEQRLAAIAESVAGQRQTLTAGEAAYAAAQQVERAMNCQGITGLSTGIRDLDQLLGGLQPGLTVVAGRPSMGKTTLANNIAVNAATTLRDAAATDQPSPVVLFYSHEMSAMELGMKINAARTGIATDRQQRGEVTSAELSALVDAATDLHDLPLIIDDSARATPHGMAARARRIHQRRGVACIITDHLQLIEADGRGGRSEDNAVQRMTSITRALKMLSKELNIPVLALSQLSRKVEDREDKRPVLSDLRESGSIEQDADTVWMLYRPEYYLTKPTRKPGETDSEFQRRNDQYSADILRVSNICEVLVRKNRLGRTGVRTLFCDLEAGRFSDLQRSA